MICKNVGGLGENLYCMETWQGISRVISKPANGGRFGFPDFRERRSGGLGMKLSTTVYSMAKRQGRALGNGSGGCRSDRSWAAGHDLAFILKALVGFHNRGSSKILANCCQFFSLSDYVMMGFISLVKQNAPTLQWEIAISNPLPLSPFCRLHRSLKNAEPHLVLTP